MCHDWMELGRDAALRFVASADFHRPASQGLLERADPVLVLVPSVQVYRWRHDAGGFAAHSRPICAQIGISLLCLPHHAGNLYTRNVDGGTYERPRSIR